MKSSIQLKTVILAASLVLQLGTLRFYAHAAPGDVDLSFDAGSGVDNTVRAVALQPDGKVILGGWFRTVRGLARNSIARLNADGSGDPTFYPGPAVHGFVNSIALQPDGKVVIGGPFVTVNGAGVARLNSDGSLDTTFNSVIEFGDVSSVAVKPDGHVFIGGKFTRVNGIIQGGIARLNSDGSLDTTFDPGSESRYYSLNSVSHLADGKVLIAGIYPHLWRLNEDGSRDASFNPDINSSGGQVFSLEVQPDGKVLIGNGPGYNESTPNGILRLNADGTPDSSFQPVTGVYSFVQSVTVQSNGKLLIAGYFTTGQGTNRNGIVRLPPARGPCAGLLAPGLFAVLSFAVHPAPGAVTEAWVQRFTTMANSSNDKAVKVVRDAAGDIIVTGDSDDGVNGFKAKFARLRVTIVPRA